MTIPVVSLPAGGAPPAAGLSSRRSHDTAIATGLLVALLLVATLLIALPLLHVLLKSLQDESGQFVGLRNFALYAGNPGLRQSLGNSLVVCLLTTIITLPLAFLYSMALERSRIPAKAMFRGIALLPILAPSLLPAIALTYMFGNQGFLKFWMQGGSIYGLPGIVMAQVFYCFPSAVLILTTALSLSDARLYEAAQVLGASRWRAFWTITLPAARYGLLSAVFVVVTLSITDFGIAKVIGGPYSVLAIDIYKQIVGRQNFQMGAVVGVVLLVPALLSYLVDMFVRRRQVALLSSRTVLFRPRRRRFFDAVMLVAVLLIALVIVAIVGTAVFASLVKMWPYDLSLSLSSYDFAAFDSLGWGAYRNSIVMSAGTAVGGTVLAFLGAYLIQKTAGNRVIAAVLHFLSMMPLAVPGLVLGLGYVFFFNSPGNPLHGLTGGLALMSLCCIAHYFTVPHMTALTAVKRLDDEFEAASASLGVPFWTLLRRVTVPVCLPAVVDIATYFFVNSMTTVAAVIFLYAPLTKVAAIAVVAMDDTGDTAAACAMAVLLLLTSAAVKALQSFTSLVVQRRTQGWRGDLRE
ncbi:MAG: putative 2-aminoethylphosphonate ABC transporter permease subunit [Burkholderiales bacterium]